MSLSWPHQRFLDQGLFLQLLILPLLQDTNPPLKVPKAPQNCSQLASPLSNLLADFPTSDFLLLLSGIYPSKVNAKSSLPKIP